MYSQPGGQRCSLSSVAGGNKLRVLQIGFHGWSEYGVHDGPSPRCSLLLDQRCWPAITIEKLSLIDHGEGDHWAVAFLSQSDLVAQDFLRLTGEDVLPRSHIQPEKGQTIYGPCVIFRQVTILGIRPLLNQLLAPFATQRLQYMTCISLPCKIGRAHV